MLERKNFLEKLLDIGRKIIPRPVFNFFQPPYHLLLALAGAIIYRFPSRKLNVIGVTGTKGKSTTVVLTGKIFQEAGYKVGWISSLTINYGKGEVMNKYHMTIPGRFFIQSALEKMLKNGCKYAIIEVTSEGIKQYRHKFINFQTAVFTNLRPEHIEAHGSFEKYRAAKAKLFKIAKKIHILNIDDENANYFLRFKAEKKYTFAIKNQKADIILDKVNLKILLLGEFNLYNALAAIAIGLSQGVELDKAVDTLKIIKEIPGRMESIIEKPFKVFVDLAHTPDSFEEIFKTVKTIPHNKIISLFGSAGGGRDKWKRPELGRIASENSDIIIICNEDSYDEKEQKIADEIAAGCKNIKPIIILDRREAINRVLSLAQENDIVLILGKGTEQTMVIGDKKFHWDDRDTAREELQKLYGK